MKFSSNNEWNLDYDLVIVKMIRWRILYKYRVSAEFAWWINYTFPGDMDLKKKKKRREGPCIVDRVPFSEKSFSFDEKLSMEHPLLYKLVIKKKKKKGTIRYVYIYAWQRIQFSLLSTIDLGCCEPRLWCTRHSMGFQWKKISLCCAKWREPR